MDNANKTPPARGRTRIDEFLDTCSAEHVNQDFDFFKFLLRETTRAVSRKLNWLSSSDVEDIAAECLGKFYGAFDFAQMDALPIDQKRKLLFRFVNVIVRHTVIDHLRRPKITGACERQAPLIDISGDQIPAAQSAIRKLSKRDQRFLELKLTKNLTYPELQEYYRTSKKVPSISALKMRMSRILKRLRGAVS